MAKLMQALRALCDGLVRVMSNVRKNADRVAAASCV